MNQATQLEAYGLSSRADYRKFSLSEKWVIGLLTKRRGLDRIISNPSTFEKPIGKAEEYEDVLELFQAMKANAVTDIPAAARMRRPVYE
jgi:hypothetical protein